MLPSLFLVCSCLLLGASCDTSISSSGSLLILSASFTGSITGSSEATLPTGSYVSYSSTITVSTTSGLLGSISNVATSIGAGNVSSSSMTNVISSSSQIVLQGSVTTTALNATGSINATATSTSTSTQPTNTTPCNNYPEFCARQYSNITEVSAHNSPL